MRKIIMAFILIICLVSECLLVFAYADDELNVGDSVYFGSYEQDNDTANGAERIKWRVLETDGDTALIISCWILDISKYNSVSGATTWENCYLRNWLNAFFYESAFSDNEKAFIENSVVIADPNPKYETDCGNDTVDKVYLLSYNEARTYLDYSVNGAVTYKATGEVVHPDLMAFFTPYALAKGAYVQDKFNSGVWWLRTQGYTGGEACNVSWAGYDSSYGHYVTMSSYGVRPVIRVKISALEKTVTDEYPNYAAVTDESSAEESSAVNSSEDTSFEQSETRSEEISDISSEESITESSEDIIIIPPESSEDGTGEEQSLVSEGSDKLEDSGTVDNKFKLIGILVCVLAALVLFKIIYGNVMRKKRY